MMGPSDDLGWAKCPRSREAIASVRELSVKDRRFRAIWQELLKEGVATTDGQPIKLWEGNRWIDL